MRLTRNRDGAGQQGNQVGSQHCSHLFQERIGDTGVGSGGAGGDLPLLIDEHPDLLNHLCHRVCHQCALVVRCLIIS